jgi:hypothetical protein
VARGVVAVPPRGAAAALPLVLVLVALLTACGGDDSDAVSTVTQTTSVTESTTVTETVIAARASAATSSAASTRSRPRPATSTGCRLEIGRIGAATPNCGSDTILDQNAPTLAYGSSWGREGIACESRRTGLRCSNREGHELRLARGSWAVS